MSSSGTVLWIDSRKPPFGEPEKNVTCGNDGNETTPPQLSADEAVEVPACTGGVLFLDVDGVLNRSGKSRQGLETEKLTLLKQIVYSTRCGIVVSSTWRKFEHSRQTIVRCLIDIGAELRGFTPELQQVGEYWTATPRGLEIETWLRENPEVNRFVILDDDDDMGSLRPHLVQTDPEEGLTADIAAEVIRRMKLGDALAV